MAKRIASSPTVLEYSVFKTSVLIGPDHIFLSKDRSVFKTLSLIGSDTILFPDCFVRFSFLTSQFSSFLDLFNLLRN